MDTTSQIGRLDYLREQINSATSILARHRRMPGGYCACLRILPCTQATAARQRLDHYRHHLALGGTTTEQPTLYIYASEPQDLNNTGNARSPADDPDQPAVTDLPDSAP